MSTYKYIQGRAGVFYHDFGDTINVYIKGIDLRKPRHIWNVAMRKGCWMIVWIIHNDKFEVRLFHGRQRCTTGMTSTEIDNNIFGPNLCRCGTKLPKDLETVLRMMETRGKR